MAVPLAELLDLSLEPRTGEVVELLRTHRQRHPEAATEG